MKKFIKVLFKIINAGLAVLGIMAIYGDILYTRKNRHLWHELRRKDYSFDDCADVAILAAKLKDKRRGTPSEFLKVSFEIPNEDYWDRIISRIEAK